LTFGQRKEEVSAHGTIAIDNVSNGWSPIWNFNSTIIKEVYPVGCIDTELNTISVFGLQTTWV